MLRPDAWKVSVALLFSGSAQLFDLALSIYLGYLIDVLSKVGSGPTLSLWLLVALYPTIVFLQALSWRVSGFAMMYVESNLRKRSYLALFEYLTGHGMEYFSNRFAGAVANKINSATRGAAGILDQFVWNYWPLALSLTGSIVYAYFVNWQVASVVVAAAAIVIPANVYLARVKARLSEQAENIRTKLRGATVDSITNIAAVLHFARQKTEFARTEALAGESYVADIRSDFFTNLMVLGNSAALFIFSIAVLMVSLHLWGQGALSAGTLISLIMVMSNLLWALSWIGNQMNNFAESYGEIQNGLKDILIPHDITDVAGAIPLQVHTGEIRFEGVAFGYSDGELFKDFHLLIQPGSRTGLVGPSGAGKTTLIALLLRNTDVQGGNISIDGQNIAEVTQDSLHGAIAIVPQEPLLFHRTIMENIRYGKLEATDAEVMEAATKAEAHDFISALPDGYHTLVGERGVKLSGGQRQRVAIARAILKAAPILILDEATSALDSESEAAIQRALHELMRGKTVIAIAHRLSTIKEMDRIIVLDGGKIVEDGTHAELVARESGMYARLWAHQAGGFISE